MQRLSQAGLVAGVHVHRAKWAWPSERRQRQIPTYLVMLAKLAGSLFASFSSLVCYDILWQRVFFFKGPAASQLVRCTSPIATCVAEAYSLASAFPELHSEKIQFEPEPRPLRGGEGRVH